MTLRVVCDPEVNLGDLPGEDEVASCSKDVSHTARWLGCKPVREAQETPYDGVAGERKG